MEQVNALEVLREAMNLEKEGIKFYSRASHSAKKEAAKSLFKQLADDELKHLEKLELVYENLSQNEEWLVLKDLLESGKGKGASPDIFDEDFDEEEVDELSAIEMGIKAEEDSIKFYKTALKSCDVWGERGCEIFKWLVDFEKGHLSTLKKRRAQITPSK